MKTSCALVALAVAAACTAEPQRFPAALIAGGASGAAEAELDDETAADDDEEAAALAATALGTPAGTAPAADAVVGEPEPEPEPEMVRTLRRHEVWVGSWKDRDLVFRAADLFASRLDVTALPVGTRVSVWVLGEDVVAAEVHRRPSAGGALIAAPALVNGIVRYYDGQGRSLEGDFVARPVAYETVSSRFGARVNPVTHRRHVHRGVDLAAERGTPVVSVGDGVVLRAGRDKKAGLHVVLRHEDGLVTKYFHLDELAEGLDVGDEVERGEQLGVVGSTGAATGPHLHFEVLRHGGSRNPARLVWPAGEKLPKRELAEHKATVRRLRAMKASDELLEWPSRPPRKAPPVEQRAKSAPPTPVRTSPA